MSTLARVGSGIAVTLFIASAIIVMIASRGVASKTRPLIVAATLLSIIGCVIEIFVTFG